MTAPDGLFDLAINRAATTLLGLGLPGLGLLEVGLAENEAESRQTDALQIWHARTRFARRVPLPEVQRCLRLRPAEGAWHWTGGPEGGWQPGKAAFP
ncbi:hypothetical protein [Deinococcus sp.]|uniref:hypothetical protein n=1 Tax=Deinococcus sp. TaxID=47478 RepID=UPI003C7DB663